MTFGRSGLSGFSVFDLAVHPIQTSTIYAASYVNGLWRSDDSGTSWRSVGTGLPAGAKVWAVEVDPLDPEVAYVALDTDGVWATTDGGATWAPMNDGLEGQAVQELAIGASGAVLYAGTGGPPYIGPGGSGVFQIRLP